MAADDRQILAGQEIRQPNAGKASTGMMFSKPRMRIVTILGTRPEIIKCSTLIPRLDELFDHTLIHTGQHYDWNMDSLFFDELGLRVPDHLLGVGSGSHANQLARMLTAIEPILMKHRPDWVLVQGDTNSTLAGALAAAKLGLPVAHLEAGCRSFNRAMPEEINRVLVDHLSSLALAADSVGIANLNAEGIAGNRVRLVGSAGIDACLRMASMVADEPVHIPGVELKGGFIVGTIHRAENTEPEIFEGLIGALCDLSSLAPVVFPVHPRTAHLLRGKPLPASLHCIEPVGYRQMIGMLQCCTALLTDSGGLQEESAVLGTPTFILRNETEWIDLVERGHHRLVGNQRADVVASVATVLENHCQLAHMRHPVGQERAGGTDRVIAALAEVESFRSLKEEVVA
jgi:UDP-N-acetylglucosamine 2-epimerase